MAELHELIEKIENPELRAQIQAAADRLTKQKKFGLVFEEHLPECTPLYDIPVRKGAKVSLRNGKANETFTVLKIENGMATCLPKNSKEAIQFAVADLVTTAELGDPIYPCLQPLGEVCNAPDSELWHTLIEADNYHALQLLEYLYAGKVDCIYIDPPYNKVNSRDWKYNCNYVDGNDSYRHSKWLSMIQKRLRIAKKLLNPENSTLIVTIDEEEYLHLGCLLEEMFPEARIQMISSVINPHGANRKDMFARVEEYIYYVFIGAASVCQGQNDMLNPEEKTTRDTWARLLRGGSSGLRVNTPNQYYPIFIREADGKYIGAGEVIPIGKSIDDVEIPEGCFALLPTGSDGKERCWGLTVESFREKIKFGYIKFGPYKEGSKYRALYHLQSGTIKAIENGEMDTFGKNDDGTLIVGTLEKPKRPVSMWVQTSHDARVHGSMLLNSYFPDIRFSYPKSLYAVKDAIKFIVRDNPAALVVDFFSGSGTTLHAVNLLNAEDGGNRRCIMVTNNEISAEERKGFEARGIKQGDPEWEARGIARYVTWPRTVCSILGRDIDGNPIEGDYGVIEEDYVVDEEDIVVSKKTGKPITKRIYARQKVQKLPKLAAIKRADGFKANAVFFKLGFLDKTKVSLGMQFKELLSTLWMKAGAIGRCPVIDEDLPNMLILPENKMAILNDENRFGEFAEQLAQHPEIDVVYLVTDYESSFVAMTQALEGKKTYQLYKDYLDNFRINAGRNNG